jgi:hypothetical protein
MRPALLALLIAFASGVEANAQTVTVDELAAPTTPAFVLLGVAPASVERPESGKAFIFNALNRLSTSDGLPKNIALELTPYWMKSNRSLTFEAYQNPTVGQSLLQSLRVSVATAPIPGATSAADPLGTKLAIGFNTKVANGRPNPAMNEKLQALYSKNTVLLTLDRELETLEDSLSAKEKALKEATTDVEKAPIITVISSIERDITKKKADVARAEASITSATMLIQSLDAQRVGFFFTVAAGQVWDFPGDDADNGAAKRSGIWLTPAYRKLRCPSCDASFDFIGVARYLKDPDTDAMFDFGGRLVWHPTKQFNSSFEVLRRKAPETSGASGESTDDSNRAAALLEYRIREDLILYGTFGQDFKKATGAKPLLALLGFNIGFGQKAAVKAPQKQ